jgi:hypothetical protein
MKVVHLCGPAGKYIPQLIDLINGASTAPTATTIGDVVFIYGPTDPSPQLLRHEQEHVLQAERMEPTWLPKGWRIRKWWGWQRFWKAYIREHIRHGYWANYYEREARIAAGEES